MNCALLCARLQNTVQPPSFDLLRQNYPTVTVTIRKDLAYFSDHDPAVLSQLSADIKKGIFPQLSTDAYEILDLPLQINLTILSQQMSNLNKQIPPQNAYPIGHSEIQKFHSESSERFLVNFSDEEGPGRIFEKVFEGVEDCKMDKVCSKEMLDVGDYHQVEGSSGRRLLGSGCQFGEKVEIEFQEKQVEESSNITPIIVKQTKQQAIEIEQLKLLTPKIQTQTQTLQIKQIGQGQVDSNDSIRKLMVQTGQQCTSDNNDQRQKQVQECLEYQILASSSDYEAKTSEVLITSPEKCPLIKEAAPRVDVQKKIESKNLNKGSLFQKRLRQIKKQDLGKLVLISLAAWVVWLIV